MKQSPREEPFETEADSIPIEQSIGDQEVRDRIIAAGSRLFLEHKYSRVTMEEIASELAISKKTLYKHFPNKEEVLRASAERIMKEGALLLDPILKGNGLPFLEKLKLYMSFLANQAVKVPPPVVEDIFKNAPSVWHEIDAFRQQRMRMFGDLIKEGIDQGLLRGDLDRDLVVSVYLSMMRSMMTPDKIVAEGHAPKDILRTIATIIFEGLLTESARKEFLT